MLRECGFVTGHVNWQVFSSSFEQGLQAVCYMFTSC
jgi:hypothetical protein